VKDKSDFEDILIALGSIIGFFAGLFLNPGGYTFIANVIIAGAGAGIGAAIGLTISRLVSAVTSSSGDKGTSI
jgi:hypothetical protein